MEGDRVDFWCLLSDAYIDKFLANGFLLFSLRENLWLLDNNIWYTYNKKSIQTDTAQLSDQVNMNAEKILVHQQQETQLNDDNVLNKQSILINTASQQYSATENIIITEKIDNEGVYVLNEQAQIQCLVSINQ